MENEQDIRVGIYGGTFAPVHNGHVNAAKLFMEQMRLDYLFVIPAAIPPHKQIDASDDPVHRLNMCALAFGEMGGVVVSDMEIKRGGKSYTVDTLRELSAKGRRLLLLCGTDMVLTFDTWYQYKEILELCYPVYMRREKDKILDDRIVKKLTKYYEESGKMFRKIVGEPMEISSTAIREKVKRGEDISSLVPPAVAEYIRLYGLYREA
ncbi:MAG: nicotinate (nicotinamide) nucleotide adenylyltransferase [Ruminococcaceae bacterium]|nr:nicotinate (nicotinamide) nucleotide adenylyltransferase [Oscillospiraceae bacterium]